MTTASSEQRRLLGAFLRTHRERLAPHAAGLAAGGRRRTPGLRREEAAQLAGVSVTWFTWLEQGREVSASPEALARVAAALQLTRAERAYLFELAGRRDPAAPASAAEAPPGLAEAVAHFEGPAYGLDRCWSAVCWNAAAERLFAGWLGGPERNLLRYLFREPQARQLIVDWPDRVRRVIAEFRADFSRSLADPQMRRLVEDLRSEDAQFFALWDEQAVLAREEGGVRRFDHPQDGRLTFEQFTFQPADRPDCKLVLLTARR
ncbi:helix-turn-helix transcriptional regulator [Phenylobacterium sp. LjRoot219]|uniref:helix-turn-helix transcriptional regulator n=1 Tax=Phenylobacterium sp. LjRoot219 TaxID=3342283 RepID=UPI003ED0B9E9